jgi:hypothetical protein
LSRRLGVEGGKLKGRHSTSPYTSGIIGNSVTV